MLGTAAGADGLHLTMNVPVTVTHLDIDPASRVIGGQQHRLLPARTFPTKDGSAPAITGPFRTDRKTRHHRCPSAVRPTAFLEIEHMFVFGDSRRLLVACQP